MDSAAFADGVSAFQSAAGVAASGGGDRPLSSSDDGACVSVTDQSDHALGGGLVATREEGKQGEKLLPAGSCDSEWQDWEAEKGGRGSSQRVKLPRPEGGVNCPRCGSDDTKFCYYNNYNIKQPRYFCKTCQRYWTVGGTLRNVPIGSGRRKSKTGGKELDKGGYGTLDPQQSFGVYNNFRNVLDPLFAYGGMVNAGKAHALGTAFSFPCPSVDSLTSNIVKREGPTCGPIQGKKPGDEADSREIGCMQMEKLVADNVCPDEERVKPEDLAEDGSVDGRRVKMKMSDNHPGRAPASIGISSSTARYMHSSSEEKECRLSGTSTSLEADWYTASAIAAMNQQMAAVMAAASSLGSNPGNPPLASASGGSTQSAIDFSTLSQQAQSFHAAHLHAQAAQVTQAQLHAQMQAQNQAHPQHVQVHNQLHAQDQAVQATQVALRMQAAQAMSQVAMAGWGQAQMPYWSGMWNPYGQWAGAQVRNQWTNVGQGAIPSGSGGSSNISADMRNEQGTMPLANAMGLDSPATFLPPSSPQPTIPGSLNPSTERVLYNGVEENHPSQNMANSPPCQNLTADQTPSMSQSIVMPACSLMGVNPWMQLPGLAAMGWGAGGCSPSVPNPFGGWMGGTSMSPFPPQFPSHLYGVQTSDFSPMNAEANGLTLGGNNSNKSGMVSGTDFSTRKESQVQDSSVF